MPIVFINYRRDDSADFSGRIADKLRTEFGARQVFMDTDDIRVGTQWAEQIQNAINTAAAVIVVIGPKWLELKREKSLRIEHEDDWVRAEIRHALVSNKPILPVVPDRSMIPAPEQLPDDIRSLLQHQVLEIRNDQFHHDIARLVAWVSDYVQPAATLRKRALRRFGLVAAVFAVVISSAWYFYLRDRGFNQTMVDIEDQHSQAKELSRDRPDSKLFGGFIVTIFPVQEVLTRTCQGLQVFSDVNVDVYLAIEDMPERVIRIDQRQGPHYASTGLELSDKSRVVVEFSGDAVYKPLIMHRRLAFLIGDIDDSGECSIYLYSYKSNTKLVEREEKDTSVIPELTTVLLEDKSQYYRVRAAEYLGAIGNYRATQPLVTAMELEKDPYVQACIAAALGDLGDTSALETLTKVYTQYERKSSYGYMFEAAMRKLGDKQ